MMHLMPTKNPRITVTLTPTIGAQIRTISEITGNSQGSLIAELLEGQERVFAKVIRALRAAQTVKDEMADNLTRDMESAQAQIERQLGFVMDSFDEGMAPLLAEAEKVKRRSRKGVPARSVAGAAGPRRTRGPDPHLLTGGSK